MRVRSNIYTAVAYTGTDQPPGTLAVEIKPGVNDLAHAQAAILATDDNFARHVKGGHMTIIEPDGGVADTPPVPVVPPPVDPRARLKGEKQADYAARMVTMDKNAATVRDFYALGDADRAALYLTMSDDDKALVDANKPTVE